MVLALGVALKEQGHTCVRMDVCGHWLLSCHCWLGERTDTQTLTKREWAP